MKAEFLFSFHRNEVKKVTKSIYNAFLKQSPNQNVETKKMF